MRVPLAKSPGAGTRRARARQDAAQDLDGEREPVALVLARREQRSHGIAVEDLGIGGGASLGIDEPAQRRLLLAILLHAHLALGDHACGQIQHHRGPTLARDADGVQVGAEPPRGAAPRRHVEPVDGIDPEHADQSLRGGHLGVVGQPPDMSRAREPDGGKSGGLGVRDGQLHSPPRDDLPEAAAAVQAGGHRRLRINPALLGGQGVLRDADDAVGVARRALQSNSPAAFGFSITKCCRQHTLTRRVGSGHKPCPKAQTLVT